MASVPEGQVVTVVYENYRSETSTRRVIPYENGFRFGANEWHKQPQYLLKVYDLEKRADRELAMSGVRKWDV